MKLQDDINEELICEFIAENDDAFRDYLFEQFATIETMQKFIHSKRSIGREFVEFARVQEEDRELDVADQLNDLSAAEVLGDE